MNIKSPCLSPVKIFASITKAPHLTMISLVPLQRPSFGAMFLRSVIGQPSFKSNLNSGSSRGIECVQILIRVPMHNSPIHVIIFNHFVSSNVCNSPGKTANAARLISLTSTFLADRIVRSFKNSGVTLLSTSSSGQMVEIRLSTLIFIESFHGEEKADYIGGAI